MNISSTEKEKVNIALVAATAGAKNADNDYNNSDGLGKKKILGRVGSVQSTRFWEVLQKIGLVLFIVTLLIGLSQVFNFQFRITKGGNEISPEDIEVHYCKRHQVH